MRGQIYLDGDTRIEFENSVEKGKGKGKEKEEICLICR